VLYLRGTVFATEGNQARIRVDSAQVPASCGAGCFCRSESDAECDWIACDAQGVHRGDRVAIAVDPRAVLRVALILFGMPLLFLLVGAAAAEALGGGSRDALAAVSGVAAFSLAVSLARRLATRAQSRGDLEPAIISIKCCSSDWKTS
jgi:positive regulator of sigma E activity